MCEDAQIGNLGDSMSKGHAVLKFMRKAHLYLGIFTTPALLFFAFTGAMQTFSLHESTPGSSYRPPAWIATLAQIHKKQDTTVPVRRTRSPATDDAVQRGSGSEGSLGPGQLGSGHASKATGSGAADQTEAGKTAQSGVPRQKSHLPMKIFFLLVAVSLALSTLTGVYMSYKYSPGWWQLTGLLAAGLVVPLLLLPF